MPGKHLFPSPCKQTQSLTVPARAHGNAVPATSTNPPRTSCTPRPGVLTIMTHGTRRFAFFFFFVLLVGFYSRPRAHGHAHGIGESYHTIHATYSTMAVVLDTRAATTIFTTTTYHVDLTSFSFLFFGLCLGVGCWVGGGRHEKWRRLVGVGWWKCLSVCRCVGRVR